MFTIALDPVPTSGTVMVGGISPGGTAASGKVANTSLKGGPNAPGT